MGGGEGERERETGTVYMRSIAIITELFSMRREGGREGEL